MSIAPLIGKKFEDISGVAGAGAVQVTTVVPLEFGVSAFNQYEYVLLYCTIVNIDEMM